ncbi:MAG: DegT/DnrJ/EryC1/StrS family aminotransferase [Clostridiales bacterium]|nr:DegT/DnrJ/EryC1/StrS family aminotransferase [Clostridiales bacterium]
MKFRDLQAQYQHLKQQIDDAVTNVMTSGGFILGKEVLELEKRLAEYVGVKHCVTCANGTDALQLAAMTLNLGKDDIVFVPDFTFFSSGEIVSLVGAIPVFVDVDRRSFNISPEALEKAVEAIAIEGKYKPKAVVAVDLFGLPAPYPELRKVCNKYDLALIEDSAQGFGGRIGNKVAGSFGDIATTSFFPAKPLGCYGDGGAVFTDNDKWADILRSLRVHGKGDNKYDNVRIGMNSRLDAIQAAILSVKLNAFEDYELDAVNQVAKRYNEMLADIEGLILPEIPEGYYSSYAQYTIVLNNQSKRDGLQEHLKSKNIPSMVYYPKPMHSQQAFAPYNFDTECLDVTKKLSETVLSLPMHPYLKDEQVAEVCEAVRYYMTAQ